MTFRHALAYVIIIHQLTAIVNTFLKKNHEICNFVDTAQMRAHLLSGSAESHFFKDLFENFFDIFLTIFQMAYLRVL